MTRAVKLLLALLMLATAASAKADSTDFPTPAALRADIDFWKRIYAEVDSSAGLLHDESDLRIVYETIRFSATPTSRQRQKQVDQRKVYYRDLLLSMAAGTAQESAAAARVAALWPQTPSAAQLRKAADRLRFQLGQADQFRLGLIRAGAYTAYVRRVLLAHDLPQELMVLPLVESSYNHLARSRLGAAGMWQFTRATGRRYLRIDRVVDERIDPFRSTDAAAQLLKQNYKLTGNWPLAITAYNHGVAGIRRALRQLGSDRIEDLVRGYSSRRFGFASRNFYVAFAAAMEVAANAEQHFGTIDRKPTSDSELLRLPHYVRVDHIATALGLEIEQLRELNPALRSPVWEGRKYVPRHYDMRVPQGLGGEPGAARLAEIPAESWFAAQQIDRLHKVRRGQTLSGIAAEYGVSPRALAQYNAIGNRDFIRVGQVLHLPQGRQMAASNAPPSGLYRIRNGDNLTLIAQRFGLRTDELIALNELSDANRLYPGEWLRVRAQADGGAVPVLAANAEPLAITEDEIEAESPTQLDALSGAQAPQPDVTADVISLDDPTDYSVAADGSVEVQVLETLGHYAAWAETNIADLRRLNRLGQRSALVVGRRLQLGLKPQAVELFERRRTAFHRRVQSAYFSRYEVTGTQEHRVRDGDSLWILALRHYGLPVWLLRQYNPDIDPDRVRAGTRLVIPLVARRQQENTAGIDHRPG